MGGLYDSRGQDMLTVYTSFPINEGLFMWVKPEWLPALRSGKQQYTYDVHSMTYTLL